MFAELRFDFRFELLERFLVATDKLSVNNVMGYVQWECLNVCDVDEWCVLPLEVALDQGDGS